MRQPRVPRRRQRAAVFHFPAGHAERLACGQPYAMYGPIDPKRCRAFPHRSHALKEAAVSAAPALPREALDDARLATITSPSDSECKKCITDPRVHAGSVLETNDLCGVPTCVDHACVCAVTVQVADHVVRRDDDVDACVGRAGVADRRRARDPAAIRGFAAGLGGAPAAGSEEDEERNGQGRTRHASTLRKRGAYRGHRENPRSGAAWHTGGSLHGASVTEFFPISPADRTTRGGDGRQVTGTCLGRSGRRDAYAVT